MEPFSSLEPRFFFAREEIMFHRRRHTSPDAREKSPHEFLSDLIFIGFSLFFSGGDEKFEKRERDERKGEALEGWPAATPTVQYSEFFREKV